jgi:hypothetical protein
LTAARAGEFELLTDELRVEYLADLRGYIKVLEEFCAANEPSKTPVSEADTPPTVFYNTEKHGLPNSGEAAFVALLLLSAYERQPGRKLSNLIDIVVADLPRYKNSPVEWSAPTAWIVTDGPTKLLRAALSVETPTLGAIAQVLHAEGAVAVVPDLSHLRTYLGRCKAGSLTGPKRDSKGITSPRHTHALIPAVQLLADRPTRVRLMAALKSAEEAPVPNASGLPLPALRAELSETREVAKAAVAGKRKAEHKAEQLVAKVADATEQLEAERKKRKSERLEEVKKIVDAWKERQKKKRRDKAAEIRAGEQAKARARVQGELSNTKRLRNEANARARTAEDALDYHKKLSADRLTKLQDTEHELAAAKAKIDEYGEVLTVSPAFKPVSLGFGVSLRSQ